ncbi:MAG: hypothetical protein U9Q66_02935 [Patescibacteria group bacterium]|nr:hypothetical protein [Patescibacteria group bacterium]
MKVLKHKKIKNTWLLFDVLTRKMVNESYQNNSAINTKQSFKIVENHFKEGTALNKELSLYRYLLEGEINKDIDINTMIDLVLESYKKSINFEQLNKEKYELFGDMKQMFENENSDVNIALQSNVSNYKTIASIYSLFEYVASDNTLYNIEQFMDSKKVVYTHINNKLNETVNEDLTKFKQLDESNKVLVFNILIEKFNKRYSNLTESQKRILKNYVNSVYDSAEFNNFMLN